MSRQSRVVSVTYRRPIRVGIAVFSIVTIGGGLAVAQTNAPQGGVTGGIVGGFSAQPPPPPAPGQPVRVGGNVPPPRKVTNVPPVFPPIAQSARVQGVVIIEAIIGPQGDVVDAKVLRSIPLLDAAALDAVKQWKYTPTLLNGIPVSVIMTVTVNFTLQDPELAPRACTEEPALRSAAAGVAAAVRFITTATAPRKLWSIDAAGERVEIANLQPGNVLSFTAATFVGRPLLVTDEQNACLAIYVPTGRNAQALLR